MKNFLQKIQKKECELKKLKIQAEKLNKQLRMEEIIFLFFCFSKYRGYLNKTPIESLILL